jgi:hypothetical protein
MTEFYRYSQRPDICEVGQHPADNVAKYTVVPAAPQESRLLTVTELRLKSCPEHVAVLRAGFLGYVLRA